MKKVYIILFHIKKRKITIDCLVYLLNVSHYISVYIALYQKQNILLKLKLTFYTLSQEAKQIIK